MSATEGIRLASARMGFLEREPGNERPRSAISITNLSADLHPVVSDDVVGRKQRIQERRRERSMVSG